MKMKGKKALHLILAIFSYQVLFVSAQSEWVWGKNSNGNNNNNNRPLGGNSSPNLQNNNRPSGSNLVPVNTVTIFGNGAGIVSGPSGSSSASGDQYFASQSGTGPQPVIVQVLQPGGSGGGLHSGGGGGAGTGSNNIPLSPGAGSTLSGSLSPFSGSSFPASPSYNPSNANDAIPVNSIRAGPPVQGEPRLFTKHLRNLFANAINNLIGGGSSSNNQHSSSNSHSNNNNHNNGFYPSGSGSGNNQGLINSLLQLGQGLGNRFPTASPLPVSSSEFNTEGNGGSSHNGGGGGGGGNCKCVPDDQCRLPFLATGSCSSGVMCCRRSGTRTISDYTDDTRTHNSHNQGNVRFQPAALRAGLFGEIVRGTSNVIDDTLDLILAPYLTQEDQKKLATRLASNAQS